MLFIISKGRSTIDLTKIDFSKSECNINEFFNCNVARHLVTLHLITYPVDNIEQNKLCSYSTIKQTFISTLKPCLMC